MRVSNTTHDSVTFTLTQTYLVLDNKNCPQVFSIDGLHLSTIFFLQW